MNTDYIGEVVATYMVAEKTSLQDRDIARESTLRTFKIHPPSIEMFWIGINDVVQSCTNANVKLVLINHVMLFEPELCCNVLVQTSTFYYYHEYLTHHTFFRFSEAEVV